MIKTMFGRGWVSLVCAIKESVANKKYASKTKAVTARLEAETGSSKYRLNSANLLFGDLIEAQTFRNGLPVLILFLRTLGWGASRLAPYSNGTALTMSCNCLLLPNARWLRPFANPCHSIVDCWVAAHSCSGQGFAILSFCLRFTKGDNTY